jgi:hypothetical protein
MVTAEDHQFAHQVVQSVEVRNKKKSQNVKFTLKKKIPNNR